MCSLKLSTVRSCNRYLCDDHQRKESFLLRLAAIPPTLKQITKTKHDSLLFFVTSARLTRLSTRLCMLQLLEPQGVHQLPQLCVQLPQFVSKSFMPSSCSMFENGTSLWYHVWTWLQVTNDGPTEKKTPEAHLVCQLLHTMSKPSSSCSSSCYLKSAFAFWPCSNLLKTCPARGRAAVMWSLSESWQSCDYFYLVAIGSCNLRLIKTLLEPVDSVGKWEHSGCLTLSLAIQVNFQSNFNHKACQGVTSCVCFYGFALPFWINQCWEIRFKDQAQLAQLRPRKQAWSVWRRL